MPPILGCSGAAMPFTWFSIDPMFPFIIAEIEREKRCPNRDLSCRKSISIDRENLSLWAYPDIRLIIKRDPLWDAKARKRDLDSSDSDLSAIPRKDGNGG